MGIDLDCSSNSLEGHRNSSQNVQAGEEDFIYGFLEIAHDSIPAITSSNPRVGLS
jgi:hypothetical protein